MNLEQALMTEGAKLVQRITAEAQERVQAALAAALVAQEAPGLIAGLREALAAAQGELAPLEAAAKQANEQQKKEEAAIAALETKARARTETRAEARERDTAAQALNEAKHRFLSTEAHTRYVEGKVKEKHQAVRALEQHIAALKGIPAPDVAVLGVIRGK